jgi:hypothetical protein
MTSSSHFVISPASKTRLMYLSTRGLIGEFFCRPKIKTRMNTREFVKVAARRGNCCLPNKTFKSSVYFRLTDSKYPIYESFPLTDRDGHLDDTVCHYMQIAILPRHIPHLLRLVESEIRLGNLESQLSLHQRLLQEITVFIKREHPLRHPIHRLARIVNHFEILPN